MKHLAAITLLGLVTFVVPGKAAILVHDGFASGGATPASDQYRTTGDYRQIAIAYRDFNNPTTDNGGQNPTTLGFQNPWTTAQFTSSGVYLRAQATSLTYTSADSISLITTAGSASLFRNGVSGAPDAKTYSRDISVTGALPSTLYFSVLVSFDANQPILFQTQTLGSSVKPHFGFGIDTNGLGFVSTSTTIGTAGTVTNTASALATNTTHLLVLKVEQTSNAVVDTLTLYVNPQLGSEGLNTAAASFTGDFFVAQNAAFELSSLFVTGTPNGSATAPTTRGVTFDEFRISTSWNDIATAVPEPTRAALFALGLSLCLVRRRP
ncbi:PEP-CTERM sorting domain-containing protein [Phragmitibacter flavus]|uniref:PEP-CTERM sorting domain-containing protein n=1 Tax=Phragmitibacter flavus TaxID=2576071 RepID=A0A5R8KEM7_9BACT|nr:PEP-CTERM sorting domain-containing protein [Phragmitibacter flavus]TLD70758.1 PEP-CTERM sorting domain-containing protein [Phragmitibacter flavus]